MSYRLTEEQELIRKNARDFAKQYLEPFAARLDESGECPAEIIRDMALHNFLGWFLPVDFGGAEVGYLSFILGVEELSRVTASVASIVIHHSAAAYAIHHWGTADQHKTYLPALASGEKLAAVAVDPSRPGWGKGKSTVTAVPQDEGHMLNGTCPYVANGGVAGLCVVFACTDPAVGAKSLSAFIVDSKAPGMTVGAKKVTMGLRACAMADVTFQNVKAELLGTVNQGASIATELLAATAIAEAAQTVGIVSTAVEHAAKYARQRVQFGRSISAFQAIQGKLADVATNCHVARLAIYDAATLLEEGKPFVTEAAMVKLFAERLGLNALFETVQVEGGYGYSEEMPMAKWFRDVYGTTIRKGFPEPLEQIIAFSIA
jgi:butyryl-CoA dehydrogenase